MKALIVVADAGRARLFKAPKQLYELIEMEDLVHAGSRLTNRQLGADKPVRSRNMKGSLQSRTFPKAHEEQMFAKELARHLKKLYTSMRYEELIIIASPKFLGRLRMELHSSVARRVTRCAGKDLSRSSMKAIVGYLKNH